MLIGIDGNEANVARKVGISEYAFELLTQFAKHQVTNIKYHVYLKEKPRPEMPSENESFKYVVFGPKKLWTQFALPLRLRMTSSKPNVFFTPSHYSPRFSPVPTAISIMDVSYLMFPDYFDKRDLYQLRNWTEYSVKKASKVFTISKSSKNDILKEYHLEPKKVEVTYPGIKPPTLAPVIYEMKHLQEKYQISNSFFLFVGTLQPRKNVVRLIEAFSELIKETKHEDLQLLIVGKKGWQFDEILGAPEKYGVTDSVKFLDFVSDEELGTLYKHAIAYVLPSLYEGFGLPILEAYTHGCPVITSNVSSLPEAAGDGAILIDPDNTGEIKSSMEKIMTDTKLRKKLIENGKEQLKKFSWEKTARETLKVLEEMAKS